MFYKKLEIPGKLQLKLCFSLISFSLILVCFSLILVWFSLMKNSGGDKELFFMRTITRNSVAVFR